MIYDYIIIGSGVAGLNAARLIPKDKKVLILTKKLPWNSNTFWAQGGIASAKNKDDIVLHINDTLEAGAFYNNLEAINTLSQNSIETINELIKSGMSFDRNSDGSLSYTKEAAHSTNRILHSNGDATGRELHCFLLQHISSNLICQATVCDLLLQDGVCYGVSYFTNDNEQKTVFSHNTIIASGGFGSIYKYHTNSTAVSGEMQGLAKLKGLNLKDMQFTQFHPTVFKGTSFARKPLLSEALRGEGAIIVDENGKRFLLDYHKDAELAPRDIVSRSIYDYHKKSGLKIYLSFEKFEKEAFKKRFPNIYLNFLDLGYNLPCQKVPISPAFHYSMGGIEVDLDTKVLNYKNLYAIGEVSCFGLHGANRLASNSLLEGLVFSKIAIDTSLEESFKIDKNSYNLKIESFIKNKDCDKEIKDSLRKIMWDSAGIIREAKSLDSAILKINSFLNKDIGRMLHLRLLCAKEVLVQARKMNKSIGAHFIKED